MAALNLQRLLPWEQRDLEATAILDQSDPMDTLVKPRADMTANHPFKAMLDWPAQRIFSVPLADIQGQQLTTARDTFHTLIDSIPMLKVLADKQGVAEIRDLNDLVPVLFKHTTLKSYPMSLLEEGQFGKLTAWLNRLTSHDLSGCDASGVGCIDDWLVWLETNTPMRVAHSSGTSGKLSFFPRSADDQWALTKGIFKAYEGIDGEPHNDFFRSGKDLVFAFLGFRGGATIPRWQADGFATWISSEDNILPLYQGAMSADVLSLQGRVKTAEAAGRLAELKINPVLLSRRDQLVSLEKARPSQLREYIANYVKHYHDRTAVVMGHWTTYLQVQEAARDMGIERVFSPQSIVTGGGGTKGQVLPPDYLQRVAEFAHVEWLPQFYGMTELSGWSRQCPNKNYHIPPYTIPFLLDYDSGQPLPRSGRQTGRFAFFDLLATTYWGGCVSGDEITIEWETPCGCGRGIPYILPLIQRYSEKGLGGDDKISCAGAHNAHEDALRFLADLKAS